MSENTSMVNNPCYSLRWMTHLAPSATYSPDSSILSGEVICSLRKMSFPRELLIFLYSLFPPNLKELNNSKEKRTYLHLKNIKLSLNLLLKDDFKIFYVFKELLPFGSTYLVGTTITLEKRGLGTKERNYTENFYDSSLVVTLFFFFLLICINKY